VDKRDISPPLAIDDKKIKEWLQKLDKWSSLICEEYSITCQDFGTEGHFTYQCKYNYDPVLATYNNEDKCNASMEVIQVVLYMGAH
jgi:hypothetical protein